MSFFIRPNPRGTAPRSKEPPASNRFAHLSARTTGTSTAAVAPAVAAGGKPASASAERERIRAVAASPHSVGRERQAMDMLGTSMSAGEITALLAKAPKAGASSGNPVLDRLAAVASGSTTPSTSAADQGAPTPRSGDQIWDRVRGRDR